MGAREGAVGVVACAEGPGHVERARCVENPGEGEDEEEHEILAPGFCAVAGAVVPVGGLVIAAGQKLGLRNGQLVHQFVPDVPPQRADGVLTLEGAKQGRELVDGRCAEHKDVHKHGERVKRVDTKVDAVGGADGQD